MFDDDIEQSLDWLCFTVATSAAAAKTALQRGDYEECIRNLNRAFDELECSDLLVSDDGREININEDDRK